MSENINRWEVSTFGISNLQKVSVKRPTPKAGEILVKVEAVSLNYREIYVLENQMGVNLDFPFSPGSDMAGTVVEVGDGVTRFTEGDRVVSMCITNWIDGDSLDWTIAPPQGGPLPGVLAEYVVMQAEWCVHAPQSLTLEEASTLPIAALTAWMALLELDHVHAGQTVVVQGTGGVSLFAVQFAVASGAKVIVTTSSDAKADRVRQLGAHHIIDRGSRPDWHTAVLELTEGRGADQVLEMVGGENFGRSVEAMKQGGRISLIGFLGSTELSAAIMPLLSKRATISAISVGPRRAMEDMIRAIDQHGIKPIVDATYPFDQVPEAFDHLKRGAFGKIVVKVGQA